MNIYWHPWFGPLLSTFGCLEVSFTHNFSLVWPDASEVPAPFLHWCVWIKYSFSFVSLSSAVFLLSVCRPTIEWIPTIEPIGNSEVIQSSGGQPLSNYQLVATIVLEEGYDIHYGYWNVKMISQKYKLFAKWERKKCWQWEIAQFEVELLTLFHFAFTSDNWGRLPKEIVFMHESGIQDK